MGLFKLRKQKENDKADIDDVDAWLRTLDADVEQVIQGPAPAPAASAVDAPGTSSNQNAVPAVAAFDPSGLLAEPAATDPPPPGQRDQTGGGLPIAPPAPQGATNVEQSPVTEHAAPEDTSWHLPEFDLPDHAAPPTAQAERAPLTYGSPNQADLENTFSPSDTFSPNSTFSPNNYAAPNESDSSVSGDAPVSDSEADNDILGSLANIGSDFGSFADEPAAGFAFDPSASPRTPEEAEKFSELLVPPAPKPSTAATPDAPLWEMNATETATNPPPAQDTTAFDPISPAPDLLTEETFAEGTFVEETFVEETFDATSFEAPSSPAESFASGPYEPATFDPTMPAPDSPSVSSIQVTEPVGYALEDFGVVLDAPAAQTDSISLSSTDAVTAPDVSTRGDRTWSVDQNECSGDTLSTPTGDDAAALLAVLGLGRTATWPEVRLTHQCLIADHLAAEQSGDQEAGPQSIERGRVIRREINTAYAGLRLLCLA